MTAQRIQRKRTKGYKTPPNTVYVGRPTKWGNPFVVGKRVDADWFRLFDLSDQIYYFISAQKIETPAQAVILFEKYQAPRLSGIEYYLNGKNLSCFCKLGQPCHADVLLKLANK